MSSIRGSRAVLWYMKISESLHSSQGLIGNLSDPNDLRCKDERTEALSGEGSIVRRKRMSTRAARVYFMNVVIKSSETLQIAVTKLDRIVVKILVR